MIHVIPDNPASDSCVPWAASVEEYMDEIAQCRGFMATLNIAETRGRLVALVQVQQVRVDPVSMQPSLIPAPRADVEKVLEQLRSRRRKVIES